MYIINDLVAYRALVIAVVVLGVARENGAVSFPLPIPLCPALPHSGRSRTCSAHQERACPRLVCNRARTPQPRPSAAVPQCPACRSPNRLCSTLVFD